MTVLLVKPGEYARVAEIDGSLSSMQEVVGGYIEAIYPYKDQVAVVCNDEGKIDGLPLNRAIVSEQTGKMIEIIAGSFFVCGLGAENFTDLSQKLLEKYKEKFYSPEFFYRYNLGPIRSLLVTPERYLTLVNSK